MSDEVHEAFAEAMRLRDEGSYEKAVQLLESLISDRVDKRSRLTAIHCQIGNIYTFYLDRPEKGELWFRKAIALKPLSELASLGLFHSLMGQKRVSEALAEMRRFVAKKPSEEYKRVLAEIGEGLDQDDEK